MKRKRGKKGVMQLPFSMIFSIILIVVFIAVAIFAIMKFIDFRKCAQTGMFKEDLQESVNRAWVSDSSSETFSGSVPSAIKEVCFVDFSKSSSGKYKEHYTQAQLYIEQEHNMFFWPLEKACEGQESFEILHIDIEKITEQDNPYCVQLERGKVDIKIKKGLYDALVKIS